MRHPAHAGCGLLHFGSVDKPHSHFEALEEGRLIPGRQILVIPCANP